VAAERLASCRIPVQYCARREDMENALLNGHIYHHNLDGWDIRWEADGPYRHWCTQIREESPHSQLILFIVLNPGILLDDGKNLRGDMGLGMIRSVLTGAPFGSLVLNLFDLATPYPAGLFDAWNARDKPRSRLIHDLIPTARIAARMMAYGDYENKLPPPRSTDIKHRIERVDACFSAIPLIATPLNPNNTPKHIRRWQVENLKDRISATIAAFASDQT
jgi:hypothetical protein